MFRPMLRWRAAGGAGGSEAAARGGAARAAEIGARRRGTHYCASFSKKTFVSSSVRGRILAAASKGG